MKLFHTIIYVKNPCNLTIGTKEALFLPRETGPLSPQIIFNLVVVVVVGLVGILVSILVSIYDVIGVVGIVGDVVVVDGGIAVVVVDGVVVGIAVVVVVFVIVKELFVRGEVMGIVGADVADQVVVVFDVVVVVEVVVVQVVVVDQVVIVFVVVEVVVEIYGQHLERLERSYTHSTRR